MKNLTDTTGNQTRDFPSFSKEPGPTVLLCTPDTTQTDEKEFTTHVQKKLKPETQNKLDFSCENS
jgi:hypothetical protein